MLLSDAMAMVLEKYNIDSVFAFTGGSSARLIDSIGKNQKMHLFCNLHEQALAMAADSYARLTQKIAVVVVTSGPGATNLLTSCAGAYYDSVPLLFITCQVASAYTSRGTKLRQNGFQETQVVDIFKKVTKYAVEAKRAEDVPGVLERAINIAYSGRKGPVLVDVPEDFLRTDITYVSNLKGIRQETQSCDYNVNFDKIKSVINSSKRPVIIIGQGVHSSYAESVVYSFITKLNIPVVTSFGAADMISRDNENYCGIIGINGHNYGNAVVQNADLLIVLGCRLDHHMTGKNTALFAPGAKILFFDIDDAEIKRLKHLYFKRMITVKGDLKKTVSNILKFKLATEKWDGWRNVCSREKEKIANANHGRITELINMLSECIDTNASIIFDTGCSLLWGMHDFMFKKGQRCITQFNHTSMGFSIPAAIGAARANRDGCVLSINGDGGIQLNIQELATIKAENLNIKIVVFNNRGYGLMLPAQNAYMEKRHFVSTLEDGIPLPDIEKVVKGYGIPVISVESTLDKASIKEQISKEGPMCIIFNIPINEEIKNSVANGIALSSIKF